MWIGKPLEAIRVHKSCLEDRGGFFTPALRAAWKEGQENKTPLPQGEIDIVATYVEWLYSGKIFTVHSDPSHKSVEYATQEEYWFIASLYLFAEKYLDDGFANAVIDTFAEALDLPNPDDGFYYAPSGLVIAAVYDRTMPGSPLRRLMAKTYFDANKNE
ncbi:hypothetical protein CKM354_000108000 [Cercospora kikuchii]|uniref:BTB domain-containing protein n=1 Tax=Cercospora kikuchii TaxID=84275 RepID=A0A9P3F8E0_9PEZI|nr:uncharacterized protein CKM354_000108000 [Cercospora kikuchii]GIZ37638.1 hypothetical protein CKM354_000108000 [Cercospora kikuchii]